MSKFGLLTDIQIKLLTLFEDLQHAPIVWQGEGSMDAWMGAQIHEAVAKAKSHIVDDPLVAFNLYARALGFLVLCHRDEDGLSDAVSHADAEIVRMETSYPGRLPEFRATLVAGIRMLQARIARMQGETDAG